MNTGDKQILINNKSILQDIHAAFTNYYPFLKIELVQIEKQGPGIKNIRAAPVLLQDNVQLAERYLLIDINGTRMVSEVVADFKIQLGLDAKMYRKSGKVWNLISLTDNWTLERQNNAGEFISSQMDLK